MHLRYKAWQKCMLLGRGSKSRVLSLMLYFSATPNRTVFWLPNQTETIIQASPAQSLTKTSTGGRQDNSTFPPSL
jgi:hypothetical protein